MTFSEETPQDKRPFWLSSLPIAVVVHVLNGTQRLGTGTLLLQRHGITLQ